MGNCIFGWTFFIETEGVVLGKNHQAHVEEIQGAATEGVSIDRSLNLVVNN